MTHLRDVLATDRHRRWIGMACGVCVLLSGGCMQSLWNDFLDPSEVGKFHGEPVSREIRATLGLLDEEAELMDASEPLPEDTVATIEDYEIGPGDRVEITIDELLRAGEARTEVRKVSDLGYISLPVLGRMKLTGLTEMEAEDALKAILKEREILPDPILSVVVREERQRWFNIVGFVARPGPVTIPKADFRMLEAISYAGSLPEEVEKVYVIRRSATVPESPAAPATSTTPTTSEPGKPAATKPVTSPPSTNTRASGGLWEDVDLLLNDVAGGVSGSRPASTQNAKASARGASANDTMTPEEQRELIEAIVPGGKASSSPAIDRVPGSSAPAIAGSSTASQDPTESLSKWIWLNGEWVEVQSTPAAESEPEGPKPPTSSAESPHWEAVADAAEDTRVIAIPIKPLQAGESRYNIAIKPRDVISVPVPEAGRRYYITGHIRGPGAYVIPTEGITMKAAVAAAGGLDSYAWPSRCEIARKIGPDQEELHQIDLDRIFTMKDPDVKLKAGDVINIGTHPLAPFMVTIANGFRTAYGFGFVYDRNFGTIDSYGGQQNPTERRRAEQAARFPALQAAFSGL